MKNSKRCRIHGGKSLGGVASATYRHGRYSRFLPKDLRRRYDASKRDAELLSHQPDLRLVDVHLQELLKQLDGKETVLALSEARRIFGEFEFARKQENHEDMDAHLEALRNVFTVGVPNETVWEDIRDVLELRRKILDTENRRIRESQTTMSSEQVLAVINYVADVLHRSVHQYANRVLARQILGKVIGDLGTIVAQPDKAPAGIARFLA